MKIIDISRSFAEDKDICIYPHKDLPIYLGHPCKAFDLLIKSHSGTYFETASHIFDDRENTDDIPLDKIFCNVSIADIPESVIGIGRKVLDQYASHVETGEGLLIRTGIRQECYLKRDAGTWMKERKVPVFGMDTELYDTGFEDPTGIFVELFEAGICIIAGLENLERITEKKAKLIVLPLKVKGISTVPCRAVVLEDD